ncbi:PREDICTED: uncharacterized protein LOC105461941, partial [Wasmannia auropunctata]
SPSHAAWEREREESNDRDSHSNRNHKSDRNRASSHSAQDNESEGRGRDDTSKRYSGNRRHRHVNENEERWYWRSESPVSARNCVNRKDNLREVRQGSEPLSMTNQNDFNRTRDTRSVEPVGHSDKFQGKPPTGRRNMKDSLPKNAKLELLPPRLQKKYLIDNGYALPNNPGTSAEDSWNGSSITFQ